MIHVPTPGTTSITTHLLYQHGIIAMTSTVFDVELDLMFEAMTTSKLLDIELKVEINWTLEVKLAPMRKFVKRSKRCSPLK